MKLEPFERYAIGFLLSRSEMMSDFDLDSLVVTSRSENSYATTINFAHSEEDGDLEKLAVLGGEYYLVHPKTDDIVDVRIVLSYGIPISAEIVPCGMDALPTNLSEFVFEKQT